MGDFQEVSVKVPTERLGEFYQWFGTWLAAPNAATRESAPQVSPWDPSEDVDLAVRAWGRFPERARSLFSTLIDNPERRFWSEQLAEMHQIPNGRFGLAGSLAWPGRTLRGMGRPLPVESAPDDRGGSVYWMTPAMARLFGEARRRSGEPLDDPFPATTAPKVDLAGPRPSL